MLLCLTALLSTLNVFAKPEMKMAPNEMPCRRWIEKNFRKGVLPPFSFDYGGESSEHFLKNWKFEKRVLNKKEADEEHISYFWTDPASGMQVECRLKLFSGFNAMEWVLYFRNKASKDSPSISNVKAVDFSVSSGQSGKWELFYADGSDAGMHDFHARNKVFAVKDSLELMPYAGRSSSRAFPYFNIKTPSGGMVFAIGWTGTWKAVISRPEENSFRVWTGMKNLDTYLRPGEEIRTPMTAILPWQGEDRMEGQNILRRFIMKHHHPKADGKPVLPPISSSFNYGDPYPCNEYTCMTSTYAIALVHRYSQFGLLPEVFWLDAGWYEKAADWKNGYNWANSVGCWKVDKERFPKGLGEIADAVHGEGCKFMVWFEPERVIKDSYWAYEHPEFLLQAGGGKAEPHPIDRKTVDSYLFDLGNEKANEWLRTQVAAMIRENKIDYYRQDYNIDPEWFWYSNDEEGRHGIREIRYIEGLYKFWDYLLEEFPGMVIDNCASGGRRLDLEATSRSIPLWRTDYNYGEPIGYQCHTYGLSQWLPVHGTGVAKADAFTSRSSLSASVIFNWKITNPGFNIIEMQKRRIEFEALRPYFLEDFYPLTGYGDMTGMGIWLAYQLNRPSDESGWIVAFRRQENTQNEIEVKLRGLDENHIFILENQDTYERFEKQGKELAAGFALKADNPGSSLLIKYWRK